MRGANSDLGYMLYNPDRDLPSFAGLEQQVPAFRNRVIGDVDLADTLGRFSG